MRCLALLLLLADVSVSVAQQPQAPATAVTMDDIKKAWHERQDKVKTLKMGWSQQIVHPKGSLTHRALVATGKASTEVIPPRDLKIDGTCNFSLSQHGSYSIEIKKTAWSFQKQDLVPYHTKTKFDGQEFHLEMISVENMPHRTIVSAKPQKDKPELRTISNYPVFWMFRGCDEQFSQDLLNEFELSPRIIQIQGRKCRELVYRSRTEDRRRTLYIDVERGYVPVAYSVVVDERTTVRLDVQYRQHPLGIWQPITWTSATVSTPGQAGESITASVTECVINEAIEYRVFKPEIKAGDLRVDETNPSSPTQTVVLNDGRIGRSVPLNQPISYNELKAEAARPRWTWSDAILVVCGGIVVISAFVYLISKTKRKERNGTA